MTGSRSGGDGVVFSPWVRTQGQGRNGRRLKILWREGVGGPQDRNDRPREGNGHEGVGGRLPRRPDPCDRERFPYQ